MIEISVLRSVLTDDVTLGCLYVNEVKPSGVRRLFDCCTIENTKHRIHSGRYKAVFEYSPKFKRELWELKDVPARSELKFHVVNYAKDLLGCVGVGDKHLYLNSDRVPDIRNSKKTLNALHKVLENQTEIIINVYE